MLVGVRLMAFKEKKAAPPRTRTEKTTQGQRLRFR
jgi:hypothetical protein